MVTCGYHGQVGVGQGKRAWRYYVDKDSHVVLREHVNKARKL